VDGVVVVGRGRGDLGWLGLSHKLSAFAHGVSIRLATLGTLKKRLLLSKRSVTVHKSNKDNTNPGTVLTMSLEDHLNSSPRSPTAPHRWPPESEERRSRAPEFYGFVAWTCTYLLFVLYILWALLPDEYIVWFGITWYPNRYVCFNFIKNFCIEKISIFFFQHPRREWAILVPSWTIVVVLLTYIVYFAIAIRATPSFNEMSAISGIYIHTTFLFQSFG